MRSARFPLHFPVQYRRLGETAWRQGITENISCSGLLFRAEESLPVEADLEVRLELPAVAAPGRAEVVCRGRVVRTVAPSEDSPWLGAAITIEAYDFLAMPR